MEEDKSRSEVDHSLARIVNEISAPGLHELHLSFQLMTARYFAMLWSILDGNNYDCGQQPKFPELRECTVYYHDKGDSQAMQTALAGLEARVRECGEIRFTRTSRAG